MARKSKYRLKNNETGEVINIIAFQSIENYVGYHIADLNLVPCSHCGQKDIWHLENTIHNCLGQNEYNRLPCGKNHICTGEPSFSWGGVKLWAKRDWTDTYEI